MPSRGTVGDPKTAKSKTPDPAIPQLAQRLAAYRLKCGNPLAGPISPDSVGDPLDVGACYQREMKDVLKRVGLLAGWRRGGDANPRYCCSPLSLFSNSLS